MVTNWICGFRRLAWVLALPLAALATFALYEVTRESVVEYDQDAITSWRLGTMPIPMRTIPEDYNKDVFKTVDVDAVRQIVSSELFAKQVKQVIGLLEQERQGIASSEELAKLAAWRLQNLPERSELEIRTVRVNWWKLLGLAVACLAGSIVLLQGSVLALAWVAEGFHAK